MSIQYKLGKDGSFTVGDPMSGFTSYAYPTSDSADAAKTQPERVAREMILRELRYPSGHDSVSGKEYDARNWARLNG